jgi:hypothetical protein
LRIVCLLSTIEQEKISLSHMIKFYMKNSELDWIEGQETVATYLHEKGTSSENIDRWLTASSQCWSASLIALLSLDKPFPTLAAFFCNRNQLLEALQEFFLYA